MMSRSIRLGLRDLPREPIAAAPWNDPVLPRSEWWIGPQANLYHARQRWRGDDGRLKDALRGAHGSTSVMAIGLGVERTWRNGWGLSSGLLLERSEQAFSHTGRRVTVEHEVTTFVVTLDEQVFVSDVDTIAHTIVEETHAAGVGRHQVLLLPMEAHWQRPVRRFTFALRAGLALELPIHRSGTMLALDGADGGIVAVQAGPSELQRRRPAALLGTAGADIGYTLHEHWMLWAGPRYLHGALPLGGGRDAHAVTGRWGLHLRLTHRFLCHTK